MAFSLNELSTVISSRAAAFRCATEYQPMAGVGSVVFPSTYEGGKYATAGYRDEKIGYRSDDERGKKLADQVLLDSVQSQANRMELELLDAWRDERIKLPVVTVDFSGNGLEKDLRVTSLEAPHRIADAILRDSLLNGVPFRHSDVGKPLDLVDLRNATALFKLCPTALVFGVWDSTGPKGGLGAKFQRAVVSELVGLNAQIGVKTASRIDPLQIKTAAGPLYASRDDGKGIGWTLEERDARKKGGAPEKFNRGSGDTQSKPGDPSKANHSNYPPSISDGGVTVAKALQTTVISLPSLRRLRFPLTPGEPSDPKVDTVAQTTLAALALCAAVLTRESGCDLRSRCQLFPTEAIKWELLDKPGEEPKTVDLDAESAIKLFNDSVDAAKKAGLPWMEKELVLTPSPQLVELVRKSQQLATASAGGE